MSKILKAVWGKQSGYVFVPRKKGSKWDEGRAFKYPDEWDAIEKRLESNSDGWDMYWCPLVFTKPQRLKDVVKPTATILWADLDFIDPKTLGALRPTIAWASSNDRYQALWALEESHPIEQVEEINRGLTYHVGADKGGWDVTQVLRVPGLLNYKYDPPQKGKLLWVERRLFSLDKVKEAVSVSPEPSSGKEESLEDMLDGWTIPKRARDLLTVDPMEVEIGDRSDRLWEIETLLVEAGLPILTIVRIIKACPWNKFKGRRDEDGQIYKEVLKAEQHVKTKGKTSAVTLDPEAKKLKESLWAVPYGDFVTKRLEPPTWLVEGIWQKGTYGMIAGEPKTYKSVLSTDLALSIASGQPFLGKFKVHTQGAVLYVQEENNEQTVQDRVFKIAAQKGLLTATRDGWALPDDMPIYFSNNYGIDLTDTESRTLLETTIQNVRPLLLILDPLYMMLGKADENSASEVRDTLRWLTYLRNQYGCSILLCHHYNKSGTSSRGGQRVRGTSQFHAWVESALYVKTTNEIFTINIEREFRAFPKTGELTVKVELGEPGELYYMTEVKTEDHGSSSAIKKEEICTILSVMPRTADEIQALAKLTRRESRDLLKELEIDGLVIKDAGGGRGKTTKYMLTTGGAEVVRKE